MIMDKYIIGILYEIYFITCETALPINEKISIFVVHCPVGQSTSKATM